MTYQCKQVDIGDKCVECLKSTAFGTGLFVNRIPADNDKYIGRKWNSKKLEKKESVISVNL